LICKKGFFDYKLPGFDFLRPYQNLNNAIPLIINTMLTKPKSINGTLSPVTGITGIGVGATVGATVGIGVGVGATVGIGVGVGATVGIGVGVGVVTAASTLQKSEAVPIAPVAPHELIAETSHLYVLLSATEKIKLLLAGSTC
jgi:hypothetical protein